MLLSLLARPRFDWLQTAQRAFPALAEAYAARAIFGSNAQSFSARVTSYVVVLLAKCKLFSVSAGSESRFRTAPH